MTFEQAIRYCETLHAGGVRLGLSRLQHALALAGDPHRHLRVVHVAGTNGKGSTARMVQSMLTAAGYRVGLYSSPAVSGICDTITLDGVGIAKETFASLVAEWAARQECLGADEALSEFELVTAVALEHFAREKVDICVLECGMGGAEDATNVCPPPLVGVITPVALDHTAFLGDSVEEITRQKCGILKPPAAVVTSPAQSPEALAVLFEEAAVRGLTVRCPNRGAAVALPSRAGETCFSYDGVTYTVPLGGEFQVDNALTALEVVRSLAVCGFAVGEDACRQGLAAASLPCRQEVVCRQPLILLDGAHNPHGVGALATELERIAGGEPITLLFGMLGDKNTAACAALLAPLVKRVVCCTPPCERALPAAVLAAQFAEAGVEEVYAESDVSLAWERASQLAAGAPLLVGGSFYTAAAVRPLACDFVANKTKNL